MHFFSAQISPLYPLEKGLLVTCICASVIIGGLLGCSSSKNIRNSLSQVYSSDFAYEEDQVLVLLVDLNPQSASIRKARLIQGDFRPAIEPIFQKESIRVQYLDIKDQVLYQKILEHPLIQYKEYSDDQGKLKYIRIEEERGSLLLKSQYSKAFQSIRIDYGIYNNYRKISQQDILVDE